MNTNQQLPIIGFIGDQESLSHLAVTISNMGFPTRRFIDIKEFITWRGNDEGKFKLKEVRLLFMGTNIDDKEIMLLYDVLIKEMQTGLLMHISEVWAYCLVLGSEDPFIWLPQILPGYKREEFNFMPHE